MLRRIRLASSHDLRRYPSISAAPLQTRLSLLWALTFLVRDATEGVEDATGIPLRSLTVREAVGLVADLENGGWILSPPQLVGWLAGEGFLRDAEDIGSPLRYLQVAGTPCLSIARDDEDHGDPR